MKQACRWLPVLLLGAFSAQAQAPANDNPAGAIALPLTATCNPLNTTNTGATTTPVTGLGYTNPGCGIAANPKDVWYTFTTNASGQGSTAVTITVTGNPAGQVRVFSSTGGAAGPFVTVGCSAGATNNTVAPPLELRGLTPSTTYYVDVAGYGSADTQGAFTICATELNLPANDAAVTSIFTLGQVAQSYNSPHVVRAVVTNLSLGSLTNVPVTLTVAGANTFTATETVATLAPNASAIVTFPAYPLTALGTNNLTVSVPADDNTANNSKAYQQDVTASRLSFIDASQPLNATGVGIGAANGVLAARYTLTQPGTVSSITPTFVGAGTAGTTYQVQLYDATGTGGTPGNVLFTSTTQTRPGATGSPAIAVPNVAIPAGDFFVAIKELNNNVGLGYQVENPLRPTTFYYQVPGSPWTLVNSTTLRTRLALEVNVVPAPTCAPVQGLTATGITATSANLTFTGTAGTNFTVTYQATGGTVQTVTPAPTASPVSLTGLTAGTSYTVTVVNNCTGGATSPAVTYTFTTAPAPPTFVTLPYNEDFETTWVDVASTHDAPTASWRNTPATGNNSWRRDDDGASGGWRYLGDDSDPTLHVYDTRFSTGAHSARFHSYGAVDGATGSLDLYVDMSTPGNKVMSFDYINPTGDDSVAVVISTNGGTTFGAPIHIARTSATFTTRTVIVPSNSATTVVRFLATSDFGDDDMGIDNLRLRVVTATRNDELAATVQLFPNPAHRAFTLKVPAGTLHNATATLHNSLGQVVQQRQLNLPTAGGEASFDVSSLAAGVYSLQLKTGAELVTKRIVVE